MSNSITPDWQAIHERVADEYDQEAEKYRNEGMSDAIVKMFHDMAAHRRKLAAYEAAKKQQAVQASLSPQDQPDYYWKDLGQSI